MIAGYKAMYQFAIDKSNSQFKAPFNQIWNDSKTFTPADTAIVTPNADTPYSDGRNGPARRARGVLSAQGGQGPLLLGAVGRHVLLQRGIHGQPHHRKRCGLLHDRRTRLEGRDSKGHQEGISAGDAVRLCHLPHPALQCAGHAECAEDPEGLRGSAAFGVSEAACAAAAPAIDWPAFNGDDRSSCSSPSISPSCCSSARSPAGQGYARQAGGGWNRSGPAMG